MNQASNWLVHDHRKYEVALDECDIAAGAENWNEAIRLFNEFVEWFKFHVQMEEEVLYPLFKQEFGDSDSELAILSEEHDDLVRLLRDLVTVIKAKAYDHFEDSLQPFRKAIAEHNEHEEKVFQRMDSDSLLMNRDEIMQRMDALQTEAGRKSWDF